MRSPECLVFQWEIMYAVSVTFLIGPVRGGYVRFALVGKQESRSGANFYVSRGTGPPAGVCDVVHRPSEGIVLVAKDGLCEEAFSDVLQDRLSGRTNKEKAKGPKVIRVNTASKKGAEKERCKAALFPGQWVRTFAIPRPPERATPMAKIFIPSQNCGLAKISDRKWVPWAEINCRPSSIVNTSSVNWANMQRLSVQAKLRYAPRRVLATPPSPKAFGSMPTLRPSEDILVVLQSTRKCHSPS